MNIPLPADEFDLPFLGDVNLCETTQHWLCNLRHRFPGSAAGVFWVDDDPGSMLNNVTVGMPQALREAAETAVFAEKRKKGLQRRAEPCWLQSTPVQVSPIWADQLMAEPFGYFSVESFSVLSSDGQVLATLLLFFNKYSIPPDAIALAQRIADQLGSLAEFQAMKFELAAVRSERKAVLDSSFDAIVIINHAQDAVQAMNPAFEALFGYGQEEAAHVRLSAIALGAWSYEEGERNALLYGKEKSSFREWFRKKNGSIFPAECVQRMFHVNGQSMSTLVIRDISDRFEADGRLALADQLFESMGEGALLIDGNLQIVAGNPALFSMTGYAKDELLNREASCLYDDSKYWRDLARRAIEMGSAQEVEVLVRKKSGQLFPCKLSLSVAGHGSLHAPRLVAIHHDVSQHRRAENQLQFLANHDVLTRLPNRMQLYRRLDRAMAQADEEKTSFAVLFIDLDRFKNVNDTFGHSAGDFLLQMVADRLLRHIRKTDLLARLGGDEFTILAEKIPDPDNVTTLANHVMEALSRPFHIEGHELFVTASIGISLYPHDGRDTETLIKNADTAMYHAKSLGKNNYQFFLADMHAKPLEHLMMESALRHALERNEFLLYYQPKVDTSTEFIFGMEALIRWNHPALGIVSPGRFIPLAEETGLIREIGCWALREACRQNAIWQHAGFPSLVVSVNLSTMQLMTPDFVEMVEAILVETGMDASCLELELTESAIMEAPEQNSRTLQALQDKGVKISIDDFGTGYSSLNYLKRFPINTLKIDQSFVRDIHTDPNDAAITDAVISLAHSLKMTVIAEGVETPEQLRYLQRNGCNAYQGYLFSRPLPSAEFQQLLTVVPQP